MDLTRLTQLSASLGLSVQSGRELADLASELNQVYPNGLDHLNLADDHLAVLEQVRQDGAADVSFLLPAMEALSAKIRRPSQPPLANTPGVRLNGPRPVRDSKILEPPMGGAVVRTSEGLVLFGAPMWFNKWNLPRYWRNGGNGMDPERLRHEVVTYAIHDSEHAGPDVGLLPHEFNSYQTFVNGMPPFTIVTESPEQAARLKAYFEDAYRGRLSADLSESVRSEYPANAFGVPDLAAEMTRGFTSPEPESLRRIESFNAAGLARIGNNVRIRRLGNQRYEIFDTGRLLGTLDLHRYPARNVARPPSPRSKKRLPEIRRRALDEGRAGVWPIGTSDGFDPHGTTSGFMIWNKGRFLLVDPPSRTLDYLEECDLPLDRLEGVIVTHGHSDHYADAIPRLVRERPDLKFYTTRTIYDLLKDQYRLALGREDLGRWNFVPIRPQTETEINGLTFTFDYTFHTVPTIGFEIWKKRNLLLYFSGDTCASVDALESHSDFIQTDRAFQILRHAIYLYLGAFQDVPPVILVEGGMPPIHTPPAETRFLLQTARQWGVDVSRFFVYHLSSKKARREGVPKWREGVEGWLELDPPPPVD